MRDDEFYIGYEAAVPAGVAARLRRTVPAAVAVVLMVAVGALVAHTRLQPARFDFGRPHTVAGWLTRQPHPSLQVDGRVIGLVGQGKHGAESALAGAMAGPIQVQGATIARGPYELLELVPGSVQPVDGVKAPPSPAAAPDASDEVTLTGEIVDSKCFLGVMNPGEGTVHRDCARVCLRGGIPPMLLVRDEAGRDMLVLLVSRAGDIMGATLAPLAGVPVDVRGRLSRDERGLVLAADPGDYRRRTR